MQAVWCVKWCVLIEGVSKTKINKWRCWLFCLPASADSTVTSRRAEQIASTSHSADQRSQQSACFL